MPAFTPLSIEYKALSTHSPSGVYVLPTPSAPLLWSGVIFIRAGPYKNAIFRFKMDLQRYGEGEGKNCYPKVKFISKVWHPMVGGGGDVDLEAFFPEWEKKSTSLVTVLTYLKKMFYMSEFNNDVCMLVGNQEALELFNNDTSDGKANFVSEVEKCVDESQLKMYENEDGSALIFTEHSEAHEVLKSLLVAPTAGGTETTAMKKLVGVIEATTGEKNV